MKHFADLLILTLVTSLLVLAYAMFRITMEAMQGGFLTPFIFAYVLGFISPILITARFMSMFTMKTVTPFNTVMSDVVGVMS